VKEFSTAIALAGGSAVLIVVSYYYLCSSEERTSQLQLTLTLLLGEEHGLKASIGQGKH
jgi:hypothetical protein